MMMTSEALQDVDECPRCHRANPAFKPVGPRQMIDLAPRGNWGLFYVVQMFSCTTCIEPVLAQGFPIGSDEARGAQLDVLELHPPAAGISDSIPAKPRAFLKDAQNSLNAASASIMASCSAVDAMLKEKGIGRRTEGKELSLRARIDAAVSQNILTKGMSDWAHRIRLDANDQRHADEDAPLATIEAAGQTLRLAMAIAELLFVLPAELPSPDDSAG